MNYRSCLGTIVHSVAIALCVVFCCVGPATRAAEDSAPSSAGYAHLLQKYPKLSPEPFGKGVFCHVRAGGKTRGSPQSLRTLAQNPYVAGTQLSYCWSELEPQEGQYRWEIIEQDMDVWAQHGKKCWLEIATAFRWDASGRLRLPEWVYRKGVPKIQAAGSAPYPVYWHPLYLELWGKFVAELGRKFDGDPRIEWAAVGGHTTGTEPRLSSKENDLVTEQEWNAALQWAWEHLEK